MQSPAKVQYLKDLTSSFPISLDRLETALPPAEVKRIREREDFYDLKLGKNVYGLDEVGRGCIAGPAVVAIVGVSKESVIPFLNDSKKLSLSLRECLAELIFSFCDYVRVFFISPREIEDKNIHQAVLDGFSQLLSDLVIQDKNTVRCYIDGKFQPKEHPYAQTVIKGDAKLLSVAAASIVAKVARDTFMQRLAHSFPQYAWEKNKGYPSREHLRALSQHGASCWHRKSFAPVARSLACEEKG